MENDGGVWRIGARLNAGPISPEMRLAPGRMEGSFLERKPRVFARRLARPGANFRQPSGLESADPWHSIL